MKQVELTASCAFGLEAPVARELKALGYETRIESTGRVRFTAEPEAIARTNLHLRMADRVVLQVGRFEAPDFDALFEGVRALPWESWIGPRAEFPVKGRSHKSKLTSVPACQRAVKKAIVEHLLAAHGVATLPETGPRYGVEIALLDDVATLTIDTTGPGLHKRGYRTSFSGAPLKETLAAALVTLSFWTPERPLVDPFCGTGTIPIEAALIGRNIAPGLRRSFAAEDWPQLPAELWEALRDQARRAILPSLPVRILGTDRDGQVLRIARRHAELAGVSEDIHFQQCDFLDLSSTKYYGCLIANPPYGQWLGRDEDIATLYRAMPEVLRRLPTWSHFFLTARDDFEKLVGQPANRRRKLYNGRIRCTYYQYHGPRPGRKAPAAPDPTAITQPSAQPSEPLSAQPSEPSSAQPSGTSPRPATPARPAFGGLPSRTREQAEAFRNRLAKRARHLRRWPTQRGITCFRLYERDIPEIPLVVDRYEDALHIAEFERPHEHSPAEHADWLDLMGRTAAEQLQIARDRVFVKHRHRQRGGDQYARVGRSREPLVVREGGLSFLVNLQDYVDTGLFLDHRITRSMVREEAAERRFLNLYGYTGTFTVYAAAGGARATTSVDLSRTYLEWTERNLELNGLASDRHRLVRADALEFLEQEGRNGHGLYDLAVVDPPTHSNSKRLEHDWDIQKDHARLFALLLPLIAPQGVVYFSTNYRRFKLDESALAGTQFQEISHRTVPPDFRNRRIHRCWRIVCP